VPEAIIRRMKHSILSELRDKHTKIENFRRAANRMATLLAAEASSHIATENHEIETPLAKTKGSRVKEEIILVPILRAGLSLLYPFMELFPESKVGFLGIKRNEETAEPSLYYNNLPEVKPNQFYIILDPMIATGGSGSMAVKAIKSRGIKEEKILYVGVIGAPDGMNALKKEAPNMKIICPEVDPELNSKKYIVPGLGDFGDRYFGTEG